MIQEVQGSVNTLREEQKKIRSSVNAMQGSVNTLPCSVSAMQEEQSRVREEQNTLLGSVFDVSAAAVPETAPPPVHPCGAGVRLWPGARCGCRESPGSKAAGRGAGWGLAGGL